MMNPPVFHRIDLKLNSPMKTNLNAARTRLLAVSLVSLLTVFQLMAAGLKLPPVNPFQKRASLAGKFIWFDLATHDVSEAKRFYKGLFEWEYVSLGSGRSAYTVIRDGGRPIGGIVFDERTVRDQSESQWIGFISVPNVKDLERAVAARSGQTLLAPARLSGRGEYAVFADPEGAVFAACHSSSGDPPDYRPQVNEWLWAEHWSAVPENAVKFYQEILGYSIKRVPTGSDEAVYHLRSQGFTRAGVVKSPDPKIKPGWLFYVRVKDVVQTVARAKEQGGKVLLAPDLNSNSARIAIIEDPAGAPLGLAEWHPPLTREED